jgi:hypothetical protein
VRTDEDVLGNGDTHYDTIGVNQYLLYQIFKEVGVGARGEWWHADGTSYGAVTGGFNLRPLPNLILRPELRYQFSEHGGNDRNQVSNDNPAGLPIGGDAIFGMDAIITF